MHGRLLFALCRSCCENSLKTFCTHTSINDHAFEGTWISEELKKAVGKGYEILKIYEIWQYKITQYNPITNERGPFVNYINTFLKIKQESSGWPTECVDDETRRKYIDNFRDTENIVLEPSKKPLPIHWPVASSNLIC